MDTSPTSVLKPSRSRSAPDWPRSESITMTFSTGQPSACARARSAYWAMGALGVLRHLAITTTTTLVLMVVLSSVGVHAQSLNSLIERLDRLEDEKNGSFARR